MGMAVVEGCSLHVKVTGIKELGIVGQEFLAGDINLWGRSLLPSRLEVLQGQPEALLPVQNARESCKVLDCIASFTMTRL